MDTRGLQPLKGPVHLSQQLRPVRMHRHTVVRHHHGFPHNLQLFQAAHFLQVVNGRQTVAHKSIRPSAENLQQSALLIRKAQGLHAPAPGQDLLRHIPLLIGHHPAPQIRQSRNKLVVLPDKNGLGIGHQRLRKEIVPLPLRRPDHPLDHVHLTRSQGLQRVLPLHGNQLIFHFQLQEHRVKHVHVKAPVDPVRVHKLIGRVIDIPRHPDHLTTPALHRKDRTYTGRWSHHQPPHKK